MFPLRPEGWDYRPVKCEDCQEWIPFHSQSCPHYDLRPIQAYEQRTMLLGDFVSTPWMRTKIPRISSPIEPELTPERDDSLRPPVVPLLLRCRWIWCHKRGEMFCSRCRTRYCSRECQIRDWKLRHRKECHSR